MDRNYEFMLCNFLEGTYNETLVVLFVAPGGG